MVPIMLNNDARYRRSPTAISTAAARLRSLGNRLLQSDFCVTLNESNESVAQRLSCRCSSWLPGEHNQSHADIDSRQ